MRRLSTTDTTDSGKTHVRSKKPLIFIILGSLLGVLLIIAAIGFFTIYLPYRNIEKKAKVVMAEVELAKADFKKNDIDLVNKRMSSISQKYADLEKEAKTIYWAGSFIPHINDFKNGIEAGRYTIKAGEEAVKAITPFADLIGFKKGTQSFNEKSTEDRLQTAVLTLDKMLARVDVISANIAEAEKRIDKIDPNRYPEKIGNTYVRGNVVLLKEQFRSIETVFVDAKPFLKELPQILGAKEEKNYLIVFQNPAEQRATGGFLTFWAVMNINKGKMSVKASSDIYDLDKEIKKHPKAPEKIQKLLKQTQFFIRDTNISPDAPTSLDLFKEQYKTAGNRVEYDGIVLMDSQVLVDILKIFGDTQVSGFNFSASIDKRCDCPQVIFALFDEVGEQVGYVKYDRKRILGDLMLELFRKVIGFSPKLYYPKFIEAMFKNLDEKHIILSFNDKDVQTAIEKLNYAGKMREYEGDFIHVNQVNFGGAKSNLFVEEEVTSETTTTNGAIKREVKIVFKNPHAASNCNLEQVRVLCLNAQLNNWVRFYVPKGSQLEGMKGFKTTEKAYEELDRTVYEGIVTVLPKGRAEVTVTYTLPSSIDAKNYQLLIQKQPGEGDKHTWKVMVDGKKKFDGILKTDTEIK